MRETEEARREEKKKAEEAKVRKALKELPADQVVAACAHGWDGMQEAIDAALGDGAWTRAVSAVPDEWEEEEAMAAIAELLQKPEASRHIWLLLEQE